MPNELIYQSEFTGSQMDERFRAVATLAEALTVLEQAIAAKYTKPADGIPSTDMDASVQSALALALTSVQSLADYYTKSQVDSIAAAIAATVNATSGEVVASLPTASASTLGKIYYVGPTSGEYDRYVTSYDGTTYSWLQIGTTDVDMTQYATKAELSQLDQEVDELNNCTVPGDYYELTGLTPTTGRAMQTNGTESGEVAGWEYFTIPVKPGEKYNITAYSGWSYRLYVIKSATTVLAVHDYSSSTSKQTAEVTIPSGAVVMYVNTDTRFGSGFYSIQKQGVAINAASVLREGGDSVEDTLSDFDRYKYPTEVYQDVLSQATRVDGEWMLNGGSTASSTMWRYYYIAVKPGQKFHVRAVAGSSGAPLWLLLNNSTVMSYDTTTTSIADNSADITIPANVNKLVLNARVNSAAEAAKITMTRAENVLDASQVYLNSETSVKGAFADIYTLLSDKLEGKTLVCCGDSITAGADMDQPGIVATPSIEVYARVGDNFVQQLANVPAAYGYQIAARHKMKYYCDGISGSTMQGMSDHSGFSLANGRYTTLPESIDYLLLWFGWNDAAFGTLGTPTDSTNASFYGAWNIVLPYLIDKYPYAKIALVVPYGSSANHRQAVRLMADKWGVACWDNYQGGTPLYYGKEPAVGVDESIVTANRAKFQANGAHPNFAGQTQLADMIEQFLRGI